ncbi:MAG: hypothetical protein GC154_19540 [bacterium]|nr:hypothetical protein [bacterium]
MIVTDRFIYLHLQKTGGTHLRVLFRKYFPELLEEQFHPRLPNGYLPKNKIVLGSIRNPWDWYISLWAYSCESASGFRNKVYAEDDDIPGKPIEQWRECFADPMDSQCFKMFLRMLYDPERRHDYQENYGVSSVWNIVGYYTYMYLRMYWMVINPLYPPNLIQNYNQLKYVDSSNNLIKHIIRCETLEEDFVRFMAGLNIPLTQHDVDELMAMPKSNSSRHRPAIEYYDDESIQWVAEKEKLIIEKYGYSPPQSA